MPIFRRGRGKSNADSSVSAPSFSQLQARQQVQPAETVVTEAVIPTHEPAPAVKGEERWIQRGVSGAHMS